MYLDVKFESVTLTPSRDLVHWDLVHMDDQMINGSPAREQPTNTH